MEIAQKSSSVGVPVYGKVAFAVAANLQLILGADMIYEVSLRFIVVISILTFLSGCSSLNKQTDLNQNITRLPAQASIDGFHFGQEFRFEKDISFEFPLDYVVFRDGDIVSQSEYAKDQQRFLKQHCAIHLAEKIETERLFSDYSIKAGQPMALIASRIEDCSNCKDTVRTSWWSLVTTDLKGKRYSLSCQIRAKSEVTDQHLVELLLSETKQVIKISK